MRIEFDTEAILGFFSTSGQSIFDYARMYLQHIDNVPWWVILLIAGFGFTALGYFLRIALDGRLKRRIRHRLANGTPSNYDTLNPEPSPPLNKERISRRITKRLHNIRQKKEEDKRLHTL